MCNASHLILCIQLPHHSGRTILQLETDQSLQHVVETLVDAGKERLDRVAWSLTELTHNVFKVRQFILLSRHSVVTCL